MHKTGLISVLLAGAFLAGSANAEPPTDSVAASQQNLPDLYKVELIVFRYNQASSGGEVFPDQVSITPAKLVDRPIAPKEFDYEGAINTLSRIVAARLAPPVSVKHENSEPAATGASTDEPAINNRAGALGASAIAASSATPITEADGTAGTETVDPAAVRAQFLGPLGFHQLGADALSLDSAYAKLEASSAYTPLLHTAWVEPALSEDKAPHVNLINFGVLNPSGTIQLYQRSYLHVALDLSYRPPAAQRAALAAADAETLKTPESTPADREHGAASTTTAGTPGLAPISFGPVLTIKTSRRIDAGALEYFDHPYFGVLVLITPYELKAAEQPESVGPAA